MAGKDISVSDLQNFSLCYKELDKENGEYVLRTSLKWFNELGELYGKDGLTPYEAAKEHLITDLGFLEKDIRFYPSETYCCDVEVSFNDSAVNKEVLAQFKGAKKWRDMEALKIGNMYEGFFTRMLSDGSINDDALLYLSVTEKGYGADGQAKDKGYIEKHPVLYRKAKETVENDDALRTRLQLIRDKVISDNVISKTKYMVGMSDYNGKQYAR